MEFLLKALHLFPQIVILVAIIYYLSQGVTPEGVLMLIGTLIGIFIFAFYSFILPNLWRDGGVSSYQQYITIASVVSVFGTLMFAVGLILLIMKTVKPAKTHF